MQTYIVDGYRIAARSLSQAKMAAEYLRARQCPRDVCRTCSTPLSGPRCKPCTTH